MSNRSRAPGLPGSHPEPQDPGSGPARTGGPGQRRERGCQAGEGPRYAGVVGVAGPAPAGHPRRPSRAAGAWSRRLSRPGPAALREPEAAPPVPSAYGAPRPPPPSCRPLKPPAGPTRAPAAQSAPRVLNRQFQTNIASHDWPMSLHPAPSARYWPASAPGAGRS